MRRFLVLATVLALTSQAATAGTLERIRDSGRCRDPVTQSVGAGNLEPLRRPRSAFEITAFGDLRVSGLRVDQRLGELNENVLDEAAGDDQGGDAEGDGPQCHAGSHPLARQIAQCEPDHVYRGSAVRVPAPVIDCAAMRRRSASAKLSTPDRCSPRCW